MIEREKAEQQKTIDRSKKMVKQFCFQNKKKTAKNTTTLGSDATDKK